MWLPRSVRWEIWCGWLVALMPSWGLGWAGQSQLCLLPAATVFGRRARRTGRNLSQGRSQISATAHGDQRALISCQNRRNVVRGQVRLARSQETWSILGGRSQTIFGPLDYRSGFATWPQRRLCVHSPWYGPARAMAWAVALGLRVVALSIARAQVVCSFLLLLRTGRHRRMGWPVSRLLTSEG